MEDTSEDETLTSKGGQEIGKTAIGTVNAEKEIQNWLDSKKILKSIREKHHEHIVVLVGAVEEGVLIVNEDNTLTHKLLWPKEGGIQELKYKHRINDNMLKQWMKGVPSDDGDQRLTAYMSALTDQAKGIINALDSTDKRIAFAITNFFL